MLLCILRCLTCNLIQTPFIAPLQNIAGLASLLSSTVDADAAEELYQRSDPPLGHAIDPAAVVVKGGNGGSPTKKAFIISDYNRDGDSYRSPWSNIYYPPLASAAGGESGGFQPSPQLRQVEMMANEVFDSYRSLYYGSGDSSVASVYLWDREGVGATEGGGGFAGAFLIKKEIKDEDSDQYLRRGTWNSVHVVEVVPSPEGRTASYGMTTAVSLVMEPSASSLSTTDGSGSTINSCIAGSLTKRSDRVLPISNNGPAGAEHIANIGTMIEDMEIELRSSMDSLHIQKTRYVLDSVRSTAAASHGGGGSAARGGGSDGRRGGPALSNQQKVATLLTEAVLARQANTGRS
jgi:capping protein beta